MAEVRLSEADCVRLAARFGRSSQEFANLNGRTIDDAADHLALGREELRAVLAENATRTPLPKTKAETSEKPVKKTAKKTAKKPVKKTAKKTAKKAAAKKT